MKQGVDLHVQDDNDDTALLAVVRATANDRPWKNVTEILFSYEFGPNAQNGQGETALHMAIHQDKFDHGEEIVRRILEAQPHLNIPEFRGRTLLQCTAIKGYTMIVEMLLGQGARVNLADKAEMTALQIVQMLSDAGADKEKQDYAGLTPLVEQLLDVSG